MCIYSVCSNLNWSISQHTDEDKLEVLHKLALLTDFLGKSVFVLEGEGGGAVVFVPILDSLRIQPPLIRSRYYVRIAKSDVCDSRPEIPY